MIRNKCQNKISKIGFIVFTLISIITILITCKGSSRKNDIEEKSVNDTSEVQVKKPEIYPEVTNDTASIAKPEVDISSSAFVKKLERRESLSLFFNDSWTLIYHEDNRCDGSTDGEIDNLKKSQVDSLIKLQVKNDGNGWGCDKKEPKGYELVFDLRKLTESWNRFEISDYEIPEGDIVYVVGSGESDYLKIYYNDSGLIIKLEYRSEDPG